MKTKKFLFMALLSGVLVVSACNMSSSKKKDNDDEDEIGSNFQADDYKGQEGATELSKEEWEKAFSIEETVMHRSVKVSFRATSQSSDVTANTEIDHGKLKMSETYEGQAMSFYVNVDSVAADGTVRYTYYYPGGENGEYRSFSMSDNKQYLTADLGILEYAYEDFTYDSSSKTYKSGAFTYEVSSDQTLYVSQCEITIKDGFPSKVELDGEASGETGHFTVNYSNYGKVKVTIPGQENNKPSSQQQGGDFSLPIGGNSQQQGGSQTGYSEISYNQLLSAYRNRPQANFNYASANVSYNGTAQTVSASLVNGEWVSASGEDYDFSGLIVDDEMMERLPNSSSGTLTYYQNGNQYLIRNVEDSGTYNIYVNQYFYITAEYIEMSGMSMSVEVTWSIR